VKLAEKKVTMELRAHDAVSRQRLTALVQNITRFLKLLDMFARLVD